jgi:hypothetical protein
MVNIDIWNQLQSIPKEKVFLFNLKDADQNYEYYLNLAERFGLSPVLERKQFISIKKKTVLPSHNEKHTWSELEEVEFKQHSKEWYSLYYELFPHLKPTSPLT